MDYSDFKLACPDPLADEAVAPLARIFARTSDSLAELPQWWLRLVGYAWACRTLISDDGKGAGVSVPPLQVPVLLALIKDPVITTHLAEYPQTFVEVTSKGL